MGELLEKKEDLIRYFQTGAKPREQWRIGTEYEKVVVRTADGTAIPYSGAGGVEALLRRMAADYGFEPEDEHGHILALKGARRESRSSRAVRSSCRASSARRSTVRARSLPTTSSS